MPSAALKKRAVLDPRCARRRWQYAVGAEECSRRGSNKRMNKQGARKNDVHHPLDKESPIQAVCGKAARTVLCGGRALKRASLPLQVPPTLLARANELIE